MSEPLERSLAHARGHFDEALEDLRALIAIPSVSSQKADRRPMQEAAQWLAQRLGRAPFTGSEIFSTDENPIVFAELGARRPGSRSILIYAHYDVHSPEPHNAWATDPFVPTAQGDRLYARGASDMKGQLIACILAVESVLLQNDFPLTLKLLIEGNEESGPSPVERFVREHPELLSCDFCFSPDAGMIGEDAPTITYGLRGRSNCLIRVSGPARDVHDGELGGVILNPTHVLSRLIDGLHDSSGRVSLPGFYDKVRLIDEDERGELARLPKDDVYFLRVSGAPALWGEEGFPAVERAATRPSLNVLQIRAGGPSSAIPSLVEAEATARLVPDQDPAEVFEQLRRYVQENTPTEATAEVVYKGGYRPTLTSRTSPGVLALRRALEETWGVEPLFDRIGGGIPIVGKLQDILGVDSVLTGFALPDDGIHGPNESVHLPTLRRGVEAMVRFFFRLAAGTRTPSP